jgi:hypothetical protein
MIHPAHEAGGIPRAEVFHDISIDSRRLGLDDLSSAFLRIYNRNHHDRKSLFYRRPGSCRGFFGIERSFDLPVYF